VAFAHGKSAVFKLDNSSSTLVDYSSYLNDVSLSRSIETAETTTFGVSGSAKTYIVGLSDANFSISGLFDATADATLAAVLGFATALDFEYGPTGSTASMIKYTGTCLMTGYNISASVGDVVQATADFQVTGPVTRTTW